jgi:hypothetical protein
MKMAQFIALKYSASIGKFLEFDPAVKIRFITSDYGYPFLRQHKKIERNEKRHSEIIPSDDVIFLTYSPLHID